LQSENKTKLNFTFLLIKVIQIIMKDDNTLLHHAIKMAGEGILHGKGPFGAIIVRKGKIISEACNSVVLSHDPTAHAEILAIRKASEVLKTHDLSDCIIYASCEPCPMCLGAIYWSGIKKVVFAAGREDAETAGFSDSLIYDEIALDPSKRMVSFIHIDTKEGREVFRQWNDFDGKVRY
jgi:tRNA(Arg) A34 adenosine deaminase TadA